MRLSNIDLDSWAEYSKAIDAHNVQQYKMVNQHERTENAKLKKERKDRIRKYEALPFFKKLYTPDPRIDRIMHYTSPLPPFIKEKSLAGYLDWLAHEHKKDSNR